MNEGVYYNLPAASYHAAPGVSQTMLKPMARSMAHFQAWLKEKREPSDAMKFGSLAHHRILEPGKPLPGIVVQPETYPAPEDHSAVKKKQVSPGDPLPWHNGAKYCRAWRAEQEGRGLIVQTASESESLDCVVNAVAKHPTAREALSGGDAEVSLFKEFTHGGRSVMRRCRIDFLNYGHRAMPDVKTCTDARPGPFAKHAFDMGYHIQGALYLDTWNELNPDKPMDFFCFIAVEKHAPYAISVFSAHRYSEFIAEGRKTYVRLLQLYMHCAEVGEWPGYSPDVQTLELPRWAKGEAA